MPEEDPVATAAGNDPAATSAEAEHEQEVVLRPQSIMAKRRTAIPTVLTCLHVPEEQDDSDLDTHNSPPDETASVPNSPASVTTTNTFRDWTKRFSFSLTSTVLIRVRMLDGTHIDFQMDRKCKGHIVLENVCESINLIEKEYFGLTFDDRFDTRAWLEMDKSISKFIKNEPWLLCFEVKFYPPDPVQLKEDITRYQLRLQLENDIAIGKLPCTSVSHAKLGSYLVQCELGNYDPNKHDSNYLRQFHFGPNQTPELEKKVIELHKSLRGQTQAEAEFHYLENAKKLALYGVHLHSAKDSEGTDVMLGVCAAGLVIFRNRNNIYRFAWPKILKIAFGKDEFYIKFQVDSKKPASVVGYKLINKIYAVKLFETCVEHHKFFRIKSHETVHTYRFLPPLGSKFPMKKALLINRKSEGINQKFDGKANTSVENSSDINMSGHIGPPYDSINIDDSSPASNFELSVYNVERDIIRDVDNVRNVTSAPKIVKTTTKQKVVQDAKGITQNIEEKVEDLTPGGSGAVTVSNTVNLADAENGETVPHVTATAVTTRTALMTEDTGKKEKTSEVEEKTIAHTTTTSATGQEKRVMTQEVRSMATVLTGDKPNLNGRERSYSTSSSDSGTPIDVDYTREYGRKPAETESRKVAFDKPRYGGNRMPAGDISKQLNPPYSTSNAPLARPEGRKVAFGGPQYGGYGTTAGEIDSNQTINSKTRTVETTTYKTEKDGLVQTKTEQKITIQSDGDPVDRDRALTEALVEAAAMNPDWRLKTIEIK